MNFEQLPGRGYPARAFPGRMLARGRPPKLGIVYPDREQLPKQAYPLGLFPRRHLARANGIVIPPRPIQGGGGGGSIWVRIPEVDERERKPKKTEEPKRGPDLFAIHRQCVEITLALLIPALEEESEL